jgi:ribosomal protein S18 acetylase RimI-like enzyme
MIRQRGITAGDRPSITALLASLDAFTEDERAVALELVDARLARPEVDDYRFILSLDASDASERLAGYLCYGRTPMTQSTYDLYWIATSPTFSRSGVARGLLATMESEIAHAGGGIIRVETGSREGHGAAVHFYDAVGFSRSAQIADFYAPGDDLLIFTKRVSAIEAPSSLDDDASLIDAAFGYRDYAAERDFFLACGRRFGSREIKRALAWACGAGRHLSAFADAGIAGVGTEGSDAMLAHARRIARARASGPAVALIRADLHERPAIDPADLSFVPLSSIHQLATPDAVATHLRNAASLLSPGGVHVIEATHPSDLTASGVSRTEWTEVRGDKTVDARFRMHIDRVSADRVVPTTLEVFCGAKGGQKSRALVQQGEWFIPDLAGWKQIVQGVPELELAAVLGDLRVDVPFDHPSAWRLILVLKKR